jgi:Ras GTPase-activating-like protein IQGAP2/3
MSDTEKSVESKTPRDKNAKDNTKNSSSNDDSSMSSEEVVLKKNNNNKEEKDDSSSEESPRPNRGEEERRALESLQEVQPIGVPQTGLDAEIAALLPAQVFNTERKCLMMTLEARMLLREMVEYRLQKDRLRSGNLSPAEIHNLLMLNMSDKEEQDFIADIQELKRQLVREIRHNRNLELDLEKLEKRIALLIQNRTSVQEIDRELKKVKKVKKQPKQNESGEIYPGLDKDRKKLESYAHLLYSMQTEPKYFAELLYVVSPEQMKRLLDKLLLTLFGDAFSPREEYLLLELFRLAIRKEIMNIANVNVLQEAGAASVIPTMVIAYNRRKQGVEYLKSALGPVMKSLVEDESSLELNAATVSNTCPYIYMGALVAVAYWSLARSIKSCAEEQ